MNPVWHALRLAVETGLWFVLVGGLIVAALYAMGNWLRVRLHH